MPVSRPLSHADLISRAAIFSSCFVWAVPMNWIAQSVAVVIGTAAAIDIIWRSEYSIGLHWLQRLILVILFSAAVVLIGGRAIRAQYDNMPEENLIASFSTQIANNITHDQNEIKVILNNHGRSPSVIDELSMITVQFHDDSNNVGERLDICEDKTIRAAATSYQMGIAVDNKRQTVKLENENEAILSYYTSDHYIVDGITTPPHPVVVEGGKSTELSTFF
jgi:hypothetical protein